jgi:YD repeat-containing protein
VETTTQNARLQMTGRTVVKSGHTLLDLGWSCGSASQNNGNVSSHSISHPGAMFTQSFSYDPLNRLKTTADTGGCNQTYVYDARGNRALLSGSCTPAGGTPPIVAADDPAHVAAIFPNNRINLASYDGSGNLTAIDGNTLAYDGEH